MTDRNLLFVILASIWVAACGIGKAIIDYRAFNRRMKSLKSFNSGQPY